MSRKLYEKINHLECQIEDDEEYIRDLEQQVRMLEQSEIKYQRAFELVWATFSSLTPHMAERLLQENPRLRELVNV